ncbi:hypothetical protein L9F63_009460, partial [Diploptera punctata]
MVIAVSIFYYVISKQMSTAVAPSCDSKDLCDKLLKPPNISDCINGICQCIGESIYVESNNTCECLDGYVVGSKKCLPLSSALGSACDEDVQCSRMGELAICDNYECYCRSGSTSVSGKCQDKKLIGQKCNTSDDCKHIKKSVCEDNICVCDEGHVPNSDARLCLR